MKEMIRIPREYESTGRIFVQRDPEEMPEKITLNTFSADIPEEILEELRREGEEKRKRFAVLLADYLKSHLERKRDSDKNVKESTQ